MTGNVPGLRYRADLEGLRAVAILLVVAAHAGVPWLAGGFIGVDVFFVLSGYLITGLLVEELRSEGRVLFARFYARRIRRLLPALLVMLLTVSAVAAWLLPYGDQVHQARAGAAAALWLSNLYFAFSDIDYFGPAADTNLFLHTWSLGVEEQFYLVWPALLVILFRSAGRDAALGMRRLRLAMILVFVVSLGASVILTDEAPRFAFYMMPVRAWQFALGALIFLWLGQGGTGARTFPGIAWAGWGGLAIILGSAIWLNAGVPYPGIRAMAPTLGAAMVIAAGTLPAISGAGRWLAAPAMQAIGRLSYAWYLWHWPVLLLGVHAGAGSAGSRLGLVLLSLALAAISTHAVEMPVRRSTRWVLRPGAVMFAGLVLMAAGHLAGIRWHNASSRLVEARASLYDRVRADLPIIYRKGCDHWYLDAEVRVCAFGDDDARYAAVVMGDSVALQWFPALERIFTHPDWRLMVVTKSSCPMVDEPIFYELIGRIFTECEEWRRAALGAVAALNPAVLILGSGYYEYTEREWKDGTTRVLEAVNGAAGRIYILAATPRLPFDGPRCLASGGKCTAPARDRRADDIQRWIRESAGKFDNVQVVDMSDVVCRGGECRAEQQGQVVYRDSQHLTATFVASLAGALASRLGVPEPAGEGVPPLAHAE